MSDLMEGQKAPDFTAKDQDGNSISLSDYLGQDVILYFYPKDNTPGCTAESCNFRDNYDLLLEEGFQVLGVSTDDEASHLKFKRKFNLPFPLIADPERDIVTAYGVWVEKNLYGKKYMGVARKTFIIDTAGIIVKIITQVDTKNASQQVLDLML